VKRVKRGFWLGLAIVILKPLISVMTKHDWRGQQNIPPGGGVIVTNHISKIDPLVLGHFIVDLPRNPRFLAKDTLFQKFFIGRVFRGAHQIPVHRNTADAAKALAAAVEAVEEGSLVLMHPEGTCTKDPDLWPMKGKTGAARLALLSGAPMIPVVQWGAQRIHHPITGKFRPRWKTPVTVIVGEPIDLLPYAGRPVTVELLDEITDATMLRLREMVAEIRGVPAPTGPLFTLPKGRKREATS
jgi:1-acyl-sn-glycerol-3-phosphate acyltransferase